MLMSIAAIGAVLIGDAGEAAVVLFLFTVGELLEGIAAGRARAGIKALIDLIPRTALRKNGSEIETVSVEEIGRAHVRTPVTNAHLVCRLLLEKKKNKQA